MIIGWSPNKVVQTVPVGCISRSRDQKVGLKMQLKKKYCPKLQDLELSCLVYNIQIMHIGSTIIVQTVA